MEPHLRGRLGDPELGGDGLVRQIEIATWIERPYHRRRRQAALGRLTPIEYETIITPQTAAAA